MALLLGLSSSNTEASAQRPFEVLTEAVASWLEPRLQFALDDGFAAGDRKIQKDPDAARECAVAASALVAHIVASDLALRGLAKSHPAAAELLEEAALSAEPAREGAQLYQRLREIPASRLEGGALLDPSRRSIGAVLALFALAIVLLAGVGIEGLRPFWSAPAAAGALAYRAGGIVMPYAMPLAEYVVGIIREYVRNDMIPLLTAPDTAYDVFANVTGSESLTSAAGNLAQELRCVAEFGLSCEGVQRSEDAFREGYGGFGDLAECLVGNNAEGYLPEVAGAATVGSVVAALHPAGSVAVATLAGAAAGRMSSCGAGRAVDYALDAVDQVTDGMSLGPFVPDQYVGPYQQRLAEHRAQQRELWQTMLALYVPLAYIVFIQPLVARRLRRKSYSRRAINWTVAIAPSIMGWMLWALSTHDQAQLAAREIAAPAGTSSPGSSVVYGRRQALWLFQTLVGPLASAAMSYTLNEGVLSPSRWLPTSLRRRIRARDPASAALCEICFDPISSRSGVVIPDWWREERLEGLKERMRERNTRRSYEITARTGDVDRGQEYLEEAEEKLERLIEVSQQRLCAQKRSCAAVRTEDGLHYHTACIEAATGLPRIEDRRMLFCPMTERLAEYEEVDSDELLSILPPRVRDVPSAAAIMRDAGDAVEEYTAMVEEAGARGIDRFEDASARVRRAKERLENAARRARSTAESAVEYAEDQAIRMRRLFELAQSTLAVVVPEIVRSARAKVEEEIRAPLPSVVKEAEDSLPEPPSPPIQRRSSRLRNRR